MAIFDDDSIALEARQRLRRRARRGATRAAEVEDGTLRGLTAWSLDRQRRRAERWQRFDASPRPTSARAPGTILERDDPASDVAVFRIARPSGLSFEPGQYLRLRAFGIRRKYSIASAPAADHVELCIERVPNGRLTSQLWTLGPGDAVEIEPRAKGKLLLAAAPAHVMFATVTGVAPFASMIRDTLPRGRRRIVLVHGARHPEQLVFHDELTDLAARYDLFDYLPAVTQPSATWTGRTGRVTEHVEDALALTGGRPRGYACGNSDMIAAIREELTTRGLAVRSEAYD